MSVYHVKYGRALGCDCQERAIDSYPQTVYNATQTLKRKISSSLNFVHIISQMFRGSFSLSLPLDEILTLLLLPYV